MTATVVLLFACSNSSAVDREFKTKTTKLIIARRLPLRSKSNIWLTWNQNNVLQWSDISTLNCVLPKDCCFIEQNISKRVSLEQTDIKNLIKCNLFSP